MQQFYLKFTEGLNIINYTWVMDIFWLSCCDFPQSFYILQLLTIGHAYPVLVDKYGSDLNSNPPPDP